MLQTLKQTPKWLAAMAMHPQNAIAGFRYRVHSWMNRMPYDAIIQGITPEDDDFRQLSFTFAVIALSARVACADGPLTREKYIAFRQSFPLKSGVCGKIRSLFTLACANETPFEHYVMQIKYIYPQKPELFASLVDRLFSIAAADGSISREAERLMAAIAHTLDISPNEYTDIRARYDRPSRAHDILGITPGSKAGAVKKRYHELMRQYHPDRFAGKDLSPELRLLLDLKASEINAAYRTLSKRAA